MVCNSVTTPPIRARAVNSRVGSTVPITDLRSSTICHATGMSPACAVCTMASRLIPAPTINALRIRPTPRNPKKI